ncbi:CbtA family protein [Leptospira yasudae]|uniref:Cobalt transporter n=1 Tax=Leptospira yasudae TaxID=2202201 RepID=A0A6N4QRN4_9LEPT|nr:CbtA family protein [Leptospira yasudae]TGL75825.1 hypothetical protein EHQ72_15000 [Leptospira yasudae]TGL81564.1 hypothetical protein EHQ77_05650 [Leptospira yasudae]TGL88424.1 hypothetical protein EHQ83_03015 [Leptospira yasudae]
MKGVFLQRLVLGSKAGLIAGLTYGILLQFLIGPLILKAEAFETKAETTSAHSHSHDPGVKAHHHHHETTVSEGDSSAPSGKRFLWTWIGCLLLGLAFGILATLAYSILEFRNILSSEFFATPWKPSLLISVAGFLIFFGIPSLGLPPQLPGVIGSEEDFEFRQFWWLQSVALSSIGLILTVYLQRRFPKGRSIAFLLCVLLWILLFGFLFWIPGVPPHSTETPVPSSLRVEFVFNSIIANLVFWSMIGFLVTRFLRTKQNVFVSAETGRA